MISVVFLLRSRFRYLITLTGLLVLASVATMSAPSFAQQNSGANATQQPAPSVANKGASSTQKRADSPRRKRGGPESSQGNEIDATPAEGQSDLIKVLQPGSRQTKK
jgi:hypothetical protein